MKKRKILAASLAAAMMLTSLPVTTAKAEEIEGGVIYVKQDIYDVTLPTTASQKFYIDPEGLIALGKADDPDTAAVGNAGTVVGLTNMYAVNKSSVPVVLSASYELKDTAKTDKAEVVTSLADADAITDLQDAKTKKVAVSISAVESATDADTSGNTCKGKVFKANDTAGVDITAASGNLSTKDEVFASASTAASASYIMTKEKYKFQLKEGKTAADAYDADSYEYVIDADADEASCVKLSIGGYCSKNADWSAYTDGTNELTLDIIFKFKKATSAQGDWKDTKTGTDEVEVGPKVTISTDGLVTISGLTADKNYKASAINNGVENGMINDSTVTWNTTNWDNTNGGTLLFQLEPSAGWVAWYTGKTLTVTITLTDGSTVTGSQVMP